jgi:hypothetical protein
MQPEDRVATIAEFRMLLRPTGGLSGNLAGSQVRVVPKTASLASSVPAAGTMPPAQVSPPPMPAAPPPAAPPPARKQTQQPVPPAPPSAQARQQQKAQGSSKQGRGVLVFFIAALLVAGGASMLVLFSGGVLQQLTNQKPQQAEPQLSPARNMPLEVEAQVPAGADDAAIRAALQEAYREAVEAQYPGAVINPNIPITIVGAVEQAGTSGGEVRYQATMQGFVAVPE